MRDAGKLSIWMLIPSSQDWLHYNNATILPLRQLFLHLHVPCPMLAIVLHRCVLDVLPERAHFLRKYVSVEARQDPKSMNTVEPVRPQVFIERSSKLEECIGLDRIFKVWVPLLPSMTQWTLGTYMLQHSLYAATQMLMRLQASAFT